MRIAARSLVGPGLMFIFSSIKVVIEGKKNAKSNNNGCIGRHRWLPRRLVTRHDAITKSTITLSKRKSSLLNKKTARL
jgi:hypothetical protein